MLGKFYDKGIALIEKYYHVFFVMLSALLIFLCFYRLDAAYINSWDEARHGINAYEMTQTGNYIVNTYDYETDYWNFKPPLSFYGILLGFKLFGTNALGLRFYSAFAYALLGILVGLFMKKRYGRLESLFCMGFLSANYLFFYAHMARAGDADSLYILFFSAAMLAMLFIPQNKNMLYVCGLMFALAFLTKSWHAALIAAIGGLYLLITGEIKKIKGKQWLLFISSFVIPILIWVVLRFTQDGLTFFKGMVTYDLLQRSTTALESHSAGPAFYYDYLFRGDYIYLPALILCFVGIFFYNRRAVSENKAEITGYLLWILVPFILFSVSKTKLIWYIYPVIIPLFMAAAIFLAKLVKENQIIYPLKIVLFAAGILITGFYTRQNITMINGLQGDAFQAFIMESTSDADRDLPAYIQVNGDKEDEPYTWSQNAQFLAETNGNHNCENGGIDGFLESNVSCVIYIAADYYGQNMDRLGSCDILYQDGSYLLLYSQGK